MKMKVGVKEVLELGDWNTARLLPVTHFWEVESQRDGKRFLTFLALLILQISMQILKNKRENK